MNIFNKRRQSPPLPDFQQHLASQETQRYMCPTQFKSTNISWDFQKNEISSTSAICAIVLVTLIKTKAFLKIALKASKAS